MLHLCYTSMVPTWKKTCVLLIIKVFKTPDALFKTGMILIGGNCFLKQKVRSVRTIIIYNKDLKMT